MSIKTIYSVYIGGEHDHFHFCFIVFTFYLFFGYITQMMKAKWGSTSDVASNSAVSYPWLLDIVSLFLWR